MTKCDCRPCAVCKGERVICNKCNMCTRCHEHAPGCPGCAGKVTPKQQEQQGPTCFKHSHPTTSSELQCLEAQKGVKVSKQESERDEAKERLRSWLKPGDTVYTIVRHVSRSGMQRELGVVLIEYDSKRKEIINRQPNWLVADVLGWRLSKDRDAVIVGGCGMDMGFHLVYELSHALFGDGQALQQRWL